MVTDKIVLCDTDVIIEFYKNNANVISQLRAIGQENILISTITAGELIYGALNKKEPNPGLQRIKATAAEEICSTVNLPEGLPPHARRDRRWHADKDNCNSLHQSRQKMSMNSYSHRPGLS